MDRQDESSQTDAAAAGGDDARAPLEAPAEADGKPARKGWPLSSLLLFALSAVLAVLALLLWNGTIRPPADAPPVTPGAIRTVDIVSTLKAAGVPAEIDGRLFVPRREFEVPGQGLKAGGAPLLLFIFPDGQTARAAFERADKANVLPPNLPGGVTVDPAEVTLAQGSNVVVALVGGDDRTREIVKSTVEGLP